MHPYMDCLFNPRIEQRVKARARDNPWIAPRIEQRFKARARDNPWIACSKHGSMLTPGQSMDSQQKREY